MMTYEEREQILFSADAFGSFGAVSGNIFYDETDFEGQWLPEMRRYYANVVGKYGAQVQSALTKLSDLDIQMICPLHGLILRGEHIPTVLNMYRMWSNYQPEEQSVVIFYGSMYGRTQEAAEAIAYTLADRGVRNIRMYDVSETECSFLISEVFRCSHLVFAAPTYNGGLYAPMAHLLEDMLALKLKNRVAALVGNGSWGPMSARKMKASLEALDNFTVLDPALNIKSAVSSSDETLIQLLCDGLMNTFRSNPSDK